ncbi:hypothetical protein NKR23_g5813 [Pleurostoma richardsiae]|uniref:Uncharacterized protein n=1 Tax=Pleurostoma richardsiae TaxID=41990 RepID=A0AA38VQ91_9PEZI|nr:hypothetical protein NKR23_g5813 [Pleurostoma richardsiae]
MAKYLARLGSEVNTRDYFAQGDTPLHDACSNGDYEGIAWLLSCGADTDITKIPRDPPVYLNDKVKTCEDFKVYVRYYWRGRGVSWATSTSIHQLVYRAEGELKDIEDEFKKYLDSLDDSSEKKETLDDKDVWRWIHFPANNMTWIKDLIYYIVKKLDTDEQNRIWEFFQRTIMDQKGVTAENCTRLPHAEDSRSVDNLGDKDGRHHARSGTSRPIDDHSSRSGETNTRPSLGNGVLRTQSAPTTNLRKPGDESMIETDQASSDSTTNRKLRAVNAGHIENERKPFRNFPRGRRLSLVFPYIDFEAETYLERKKVNPRSQTPHFRKMTRLHEVYPRFSGSAGLQIPPTLDSSYYDMLEKEKIGVRDKDQVVLKWFKTKIKRRKIEDEDAALREYLAFLGTYRASSGSDDQTTTAGDTEDPESHWTQFSLAPRPDDRPKSDPNVLAQPEDDSDRTKAPSTSALWLETSAGTTASDTEASLKPKSKLLTSRDAVDTQTSSPADTSDNQDTPVKGDNGKRINTGEDIPKLLMIHQMWLWKLDDSGIESLQEPEDLIELIIYECATYLDEFRYAGVGDHILDIFDNTAALRADQEVRCFKFFREQIKNRGERKAFNREAVKSITDEIKLIYELKDIRDEIHLIRRVFEAQAEVLEKFTRIFWPGPSEAARQCRESYFEHCGTRALITRTIRLDENASRTLEGLDYLVQVKQAQSSLDEAEASRSLNNYIMVFTIVTILFTPLSFMTSLFAMPVNQFPHDGNSQLSYDSIWLVRRLFAGEITSLVVVGLIIAFLWTPHGYIGLRWHRHSPPPSRPLINEGIDDDDVIDNGRRPYNFDDNDLPRWRRRPTFRRLMPRRYIDAEQ